MTDRATTRERILEASRRLFNERTYAATSLAEIAAHVGITKGNLTYHYPTKYALVVECAKRAREQRREQFRLERPASLAEEYVDTVRVAMEQAREWRFLVRDGAQFRKGRRARRPDPDAAAEIRHLTALLQRFQTEGMLREDPAIDIAAIAYSVWVVSRFWIDHLVQDEACVEVTWADLERGMRQHFAVLMLVLTDGARMEVESALAGLLSRNGTRAA